MHCLKVSGKHCTPSLLLCFQKLVPLNPSVVPALETLKIENLTMHYCL